VKKHLSLRFCLLLSSNLILLRSHAGTINFDGGSIADLPRCCQQRPVPRTRREQGVPFCVRAPQSETASFGSVGNSPTAPFGAGELDAEDEVEFSFDELTEDRAERLLVATGVVANFPCSTTSGGAAGLPARPIRNPAPRSAEVASTIHTKAVLRNRFSHNEQNLRLVHKRHRARSMCAPHSAQKFGRYIVVRNSVRDEFYFVFIFVSCMGYVAKTKHMCYLTTVSKARGKRAVPAANHLQ